MIKKDYKKKKKRMKRKNNYLKNKDLYNNNNLIKAIMINRTYFLKFLMLEMLKKLKPKLIY